MYVKNEGAWNISPLNLVDILLVPECPLELNACIHVQTCPEWQPISIYVNVALLILSPRCSGSSFCMRRNPSPGTSVVATDYAIPIALALPLCSGGFFFFLRRIFFELVDFL